MTIPNGTPGAPGTTAVRSGRAERGASVDDDMTLGGGGAHPIRRSGLIALLLASVAAAGCANGRVSEQDDIRGTVRTFLDQCAEQQVLRVLDALVPAAQKMVVHAGSPERGCARVLGTDPSGGPTAEQFGAATFRVVAFDGARSRVSVDIAGEMQELELSRGDGLWRIEGP